MDYIQHKYQSGRRFAQRSAPIAKHALCMSAISSARHNTEMLKIFRDKISSGKSKKEALIIITKK